MSAMTDLAVSQVRRHPGRIVAVLLAVMISVGYLTATLGFMATERQAVAASVTARTAVADVVVSSEDGLAAPLAKQLAAVRTAPGVKDVELGYQAGGNINQTPLTLTSMPQSPSLMWATLASGRWPTDDHQIAIGRTTAAAQNLSVGDTVAIDAGHGDKQLTVTGITDETRSLFSGQAQNGFVVPGFFTSVTDPGGNLLVVGDGSISPDQLAASLQHRLGTKLTAVTSADYGQQQLTGLADGADVLQNLLLIFGAIALLVGMILIVNTFLILLAQRRRQIGLLRAVGATGDQVRRSLLVEALITGVIGSILGVGLGIGVSAVAAGISGSLRAGLVIPPTVALAGGVGVIITLLAALGPSGRATRVSPLEALRPVPDTATDRRISFLTAIPSLLVASAGVALIAYGLHSRAQALLLCVAGSLLLALGVLIGVKLYFPALIRLLGLATRPLGPIGRLATNNTARNPGRAAATGAALMLATGLIVTLQVGAASVKQSTSLMFDQHYPVDVTVSSDTRLPAGVVDQVAAIDGITGVAPVRGVTAKVTTGDHQSAELRMISGNKINSVINPGAGSLPTDAILIDPLIAQSLGLSAGDTVTVGYRSWQRQLRIEPSRIAADDALVVSTGLMAQAAPQAPVTGVWAKAGPAADVVKINSALTKITKDHPDLILSGSLTSKATYGTLLDTLLTIATVLLGVAVLIALIGVGNTLGLSVIERGRESALLRALGLQRRQLRLMLGIEAVLLAVGGAIVGVAAGALFGWIGTEAVGTELDYPTVVFAMSAPQTILVGIVAVIAGVLASILPGRRAARSAPIEALADA
ncbi:membrane protein [Microlunatus endophyticus]|uniref:Membrane protein n=1 Tax=Microlunatus endophyticus TaxID=1716077 RepID=A0A917W4V1_9ACTN|nr:FtsX-like permease family protein [Microlunatus endophyticus]GGL68641.1 membrane protein [Microlunatus endophyticus]